MTLPAWEITVNELLRSPSLETYRTMAVHRRIPPSRAGKQKKAKINIKNLHFHSKNPKEIFGFFYALEFIVPKDRKK